MTMIDDALREWDDKYHFKPLRGRKAKVTFTGVKVAPSVPKTPRRTGAVAARDRVKGIVRKSPEVMVKISGGGKGMRAIKAHMDYISRNGDVVLENEAGELFDGKEAVRDLRRDWKEGQYGIPEESHRKEAFNIVLSMPPGTDRKSVTNAAREFAKAEFGGNFEYVFATHDDEKHPHVHLCVKAQGDDGTRLNPRKADLQRWREGFAEKLRDDGIEANATPRFIRGVRRKKRHQAAYHVDAPRQHGDPQKPSLKSSSKAAKSYGRLANALLEGDKEDTQLALAITKAVESLVDPNTTKRVKQPEEPDKASQSPQADPSSTKKKSFPER